LPGKLVVTKQPGGSRIALVGASGKTLLVSDTFTEPRAKGATLRALRNILGEGFPIEDQATAGDRTQASAANGLREDITALKSKALRRGRSAVKSAKTAIESAVEQVANTGSEPTTSRPGRATAKVSPSTKGAKKTAPGSAKPAKKTPAASTKGAKKTAPGSATTAKRTPATNSAPTR
jgi:hypothetical protein